MTQPLLVMVMGLVQLRAHVNVLTDGQELIAQVCLFYFFLLLCGPAEYRKFVAKSNWIPV